MADPSEGRAEGQPQPAFQDDSYIMKAGRERLLQFFRFGHLRRDLQAASRPFADLACWIVGHVPDTPERTVGLWRLLEAKDACIRAVIAEKGP